MITDLRLQNFRSYQDESFEFEPGVNIIVGPNAAGKTNLLEAVQMVCLGKSYRSRDLGLIRNDEPWARLDAHTTLGPRTVKLERSPNNARAQKTFSINDKQLKHLRHDKVVPVVLFEPEHLQLLTGPKEYRRDFLDDLLEQTLPGFGLTRSQYKRALAQRNALLKHGHSLSHELFAWNIRLSEIGGKIATERISLIDKLSPTFDRLYRQLSGGRDKLEVTYAGTCNVRDYGSSLLHKLETSTDLDFQRGFTAYGPHRDEFILSINGRPAAEVASRGEVRTLLLGIKLFELQLIEQIHGRKPILLLDDVFSELDGKRRRALTEFLTGHQTFITTTDADIVVQHFMGSCNIIPINKL